MRVVTIGSGPTGIAAGLLLARQGHEVTLVDRDPGPVEGREWNRLGVMQFNLPHGFRAQGRDALASRLPDVLDAVVAAGAVITPFGLQCRRSVFERAMWEHAGREPRVTRLTGHVDSVLVDRGTAVGVVVDGRAVPADLVVDAAGRAGRSTAGLRPGGTRVDSGLAYAARQYRLLPNAEPGSTVVGPAAAHEQEGYSVLLFPHDAGTFTVLFVRMKDDAELAVLRETAAFEAAAQVLPDVAAWVEPRRAKPIDVVRAGAGVVNSYRGQATGTTRLLAVGDAVCTTNPTGGRGVSLGIQSAVALADIVAGRPSSTWTAELDAWCDAHLRPWCDDHLVTDAATLASSRGEDLDPDGEIPWTLVATVAAERHPEWMAMLGPFFGMAALPASLDPLREQVRGLLRTGWRPAPKPGPTRADLLAAVRSVTLAA